MAWGLSQWYLKKAFRKVFASSFPPSPAGFLALYCYKCIPSYKSYEVLGVMDPSLLCSWLFSIKQLIRNMWKSTHPQTLSCLLSVWSTENGVPVHQWQSDLQTLCKKSWGGHTILMDRLCTGFKTEVMSRKQRSIYLKTWACFIFLLKILLFNPWNKNLENQYRNVKVFIPFVWIWLKCWYSTPHLMLMASSARSYLHPIQMRVIIWSWDRLLTHAN